MKFVRYLCTSFILLSIIVLISGCSEEGGKPLDNGLKTEGYILKVEEGRILVAEDITSEKYEEIKDKTMSEWDEERISLIYLSYDNTSKLKVGNKVEVWIKGGIDQSYPAQAEARKIEVKD